MKQRVVIASLTIVLVGAGFAAGFWSARSRCQVPPPPPRLLGELSARTEAKPEKKAETKSDKKSEKKAEPSPAVAQETTELARQIDRLRPQIEEFRAHLSAIDHEMDKRIDAILRPDQRELFLDLVRRGEQYRALQDEASKLSTPLTIEEIRELQQQPLQQMLSIIVVPIRVYWNTRQLKLDDTQKAQLTEILKWRRDRFIELIDHSPPPSLELSTLAPLAKRLGVPEKPKK